MLDVVLYQPKIPQNTGNIVRSCSVTGSDLYLLPPLGFEPTDAQLKRAGLDYWLGVNVTIVEEDLDAWIKERSKRCVFFSSKATKLYTNYVYEPDSILVFGSETHGLPDQWHQNYPDQFVTLPMVENARCLNLSTSVGIGLFEAWRQIGFQGYKQKNAV